MKDLLTEEYLEEITEELNTIICDMSNETVGIIADRLKECENLTPTDIAKLKNTLRIADIKKIKTVLAELSEKAIKEIDKIFDDVAKKNEEMAKEFYEYNKVDQVTYLKNKEMNKIVNSALINAKKDFLNISDTTAIELILNGKATNMQVAYNKAIDNAIFALNQGVVTYTQAIRKTIVELSQNGTRVRYESGYTRRLDSAVRMNILDGCRQMSLSMREQQAKEYGADGWEISAHALCRPDHQSSQGKVFGFKEFEQLQGVLRTPIATGELNCKHIKTGVIMAINQPAYDKDEIKELNRLSNEKVTFTGLSGNELSKTRYECSQYMRAVETSIRELKDVETTLKRVGDSVGAKKYRAKITKKTKEYKRICKEMGLSPMLDRI